MALQASIDYRGTAFGWAPGWSASRSWPQLIHELTSERARRELEVEHPTDLEAEPVEAQ